MCSSDSSGGASILVPLHVPLGSLLLLSTAMCSDKHVAKCATFTSGYSVPLLFPLPEPLLVEGNIHVRGLRKRVRFMEGGSENDSEDRVKALKSTLSHITHLWYAAIYFFNIA